MKRKTYRATIVNSGHTSIMLVGGYNKPSVKKQLTDFFMKTNQIHIKLTGHTWSSTKPW